MRLNAANCVESVHAQNQISKFWNPCTLVVFGVSSINRTNSLLFLSTKPLQSVVDFSITEGPKSVPESSLGIYVFCSLQISNQQMCHTSTRGGKYLLCKVVFWSSQIGLSMFLSLFVSIETISLALVHGSIISLDNELLNLLKFHYVWWYCPKTTLRWAENPFVEEWFPAFCACAANLLIADL